GLRCRRAGLDAGPWYGVDDATGGVNGTPITPCRASGRQLRRPSRDVAVLRTSPFDSGASASTLGLSCVSGRDGRTGSPHQVGPGAGVFSTRDVTPAAPFA